MNNKLKMFTMFGFIEVISDLLIRDYDNNETIRWRSLKLKESSAEGAKHYHKNYKQRLTHGELKKIKVFIKNFNTDSENISIIEILSFMLCLTEPAIQATRKMNQDVFNIIYKRILWLLNYFDPSLDHYLLYVSASERYAKWK